MWEIRENYSKSRKYFNVEGKGLVDPKDIKVGDKIILENGEIATVLSAEEKTTGGPQTTYNLEVEDYHTYFVGTSGILVHNTCGGDEVAEIIGKAHGSPEHQAEINRIAGEMAQSGDYSKFI